MALVEVEDGRLDTQAAEGPHPTDTEDAVLGEPYIAVALVQPGRHPPRDLGVAVHVGVEQVQTAPVRRRPARSAAATSSP